MSAKRDSEGPAGRSRDELLQRVYRRGEYLRRRSLAMRACAGLSATVLVVGVAAAVPGSGPDRTVVDAADDGRATGAPTSVADPAGERPGTDASEVTVPPGPTTTAKCRNSFDPSCGPFFWDPQPDPDERVVIQVTSVRGDDGTEYLGHEGITVPIGRTLTLKIAAHDPDGPSFSQIDCNMTAAWGDGSSGGDGCTEQPSCVARHGPWDPPAKQRYETRRIWQHTYLTAGDFTLVIRSQSPGCEHPYAADGKASIRVRVVAESPTTTTTTTTLLPGGVG